MKTFLLYMIVFAISLCVVAGLMFGMIKFTPNIFNLIGENNSNTIIANDSTQVPMIGPNMAVEKNDIDSLSGNNLVDSEIKIDSVDDNENIGSKIPKSIPIDTMINNKIISQNENSAVHKINEAKTAAKYFENMNAESAVKILNGMSDDEAKNILNNIKKRQAGKILSLLDPVRAARILR
jgi:hypothetical protein